MRAAVAVASFSIMGVIASPNVAVTAELNGTSKSIQFAVTSQ